MTRLKQALSSNRSAHTGKPLEKHLMFDHTTAARALLGLCASAALNAAAQNYPVKTVRYIVPMSAGSGADTIGRIVASGMTQVFGQQFIIDNRTGAAGNLGADIAAKSPADQAQVRKRD